MCHRLLIVPRYGLSDALYIMKRRLTTAAVLMMTSVGVPLARSCVAAICDEPAKMITLVAKACHGVRPDEIAAVPQATPKGTVAMIKGTKARMPSRNSERAFGIWCIDEICE